MNFLKKGPELKLSEIKVPGFLRDLYWDLRDRHLLPLAAILLVAIAVIPIAFGQSTEAPPPSAGAAEDAAISSAVARNAGQLVAKSTPGLRDYKRRLQHLRAKDPFKQKYSGAPEGTSATPSPSPSEVESPESSPSSSAPEPLTPSEPSSESETGNEGAPVPGKGELTYFSYAIDVRVVPGGGQESSGEGGKATVRRNLPELTMFPSRKTPAAIYMGSTKDGKKALLLISSNVQAIFGDAKCVLGSETCELLALEPGLPETIVYGGAGKTYKIELLKIHLVESEKLNKAPLGKPKNSKPHPHPHG
ncbi:MAG TPA: hypothetical protein VGO24_06005 [Solirubrobacterales bacterium]|jgi:hypothetical protein|nr:hypothetical protein [Solirubrobacterales bacterium]